jgi:colanic acid/amylovoran biosynthesis glycosyltransferase
MMQTMSNQDLSIAYMLQTFPSITLTFVYREIQALRERGFTVYPFSTYRPAPADLSDEAVPFVDETFYIFPLSWSVIISAHARYLIHRPLRYLRALVYVLSLRDETWSTRWRTLRHFVYGMVAIRELERIQIQHIHAHFGWGASSIALIGSKLLGIPFSVTFHSFHSKDAYPQRLLPKQKIQAARFIVAISEYHRQFLRSFLPKEDPGDKIHVVHHGLDPSVFSSSLESLRGGDEFTISAVGQLIPCKGFDILIEACHYLVQRGESFRCFIWGEGPERKRLEALVAQYHLGDVVHLPGWIDQKELPDSLLRTDVFSLPCYQDESGRQDGLPVVLTEAMAMELPVVSTPIAAIPELVDHECTGLLVPPRDARALADALQRLKKDPALRARMGAQGRQKVLEQFNIQRSAERLAELFQSYAQ